MIDVHAHLSDPRVAPLEEVLERARRAGVEHILMAGTSPDDWDRQREISREHEEVSMVFGLHPWEATGHDVVQEGLKSLEAALERSPAPVAIGETGLDRGRRHKSNLGYQRASLMGHLRLALERDLPVVLHVVQAHGLMLDILRDLPCPPRAVVHAFDASLEVAKGYEALGIHLSIGGRVCAPNARRLHRAVPQLNRSLLLIETDSPDQHPSGTAVELNEPANLLTIATRLAALRGEDPLEVGVYTAQNARRLFRLGV